MTIQASRTPLSGEFRPAVNMSGEEFENFNEITPEVFQRFEDHPEVFSACESLADKVKAALDALP